jgi:hypothetical protein
MKELKDQLCKDITNIESEEKQEMSTEVKENDEKVESAVDKFFQ